MYFVMFFICFILINVMYIDNNFILSIGMSGCIVSFLGSMDCKYIKYEY